MLLRFTKEAREQLRVRRKKVRGTITSMIFAAAAWLSGRLWMSVGRRRAKLLQTSEQHSITTRRITLRIADGLLQVAHRLRDACDDRGDVCICLGLRRG